IAARTIADLGKGEHLDGLRALAKVRDVARALAACEKAGIFPGALRPQEIALESAGRVEAWIYADAYVKACLATADGAKDTRADGPRANSGPSPRWTPPEQTRGAPWDNAANRYVLGLVAYRLVAGAHPFSGAGLREAMRAQDAQPPPFADDVARALKPGVQ